MTLPSSAPDRNWRIAHSEFSMGWGGQEHRVIAELEGFQNRGNPVFLIAPKASQVYARAQAAGLRTRVLPKGKLSLIGSVFALAHWLGEERIDVLNTHSSRDGWFVALAGRLAGVPLIIRSRHVDVGYHTPRISRHAFTTLADHVLTTSDRIRRHLQLRLELEPERLTTLPTGIDLDRFHPDGPKAPELERIRKTGVRLVGMVSVIRSWKGHEVFINAVRRLLERDSKLQVVIAGAGPQEAILRVWVNDTGMPERFHLLGHTENVPEVLRTLDVLAIPSLGHEGVPQIGLQALACETPVIGSDIGGIPEIIQPGKTGRIFRAGDVDSVAETLHSALAQKKESARMATNGRTLVERSHSREHMIDVLDELYVNLLNEQSIKG
jgi:glycosyltransferase involved in cell wall biosynthesis